MKDYEEAAVDALVEALRVISGNHDREDLAKAALEAWKRASWWRREGR